MDNSVIAKSGWLFKQSDSWQRNWVELYRDGYLKYYESDCSPNAEDTIFMPTECIAIKTGSQVRIATDIRPPTHLVSLSSFSVTASNDREWIFCGDTLDDMRAWQLALEQARLLIVRPPTSAHYFQRQPHLMTTHQQQQYLNAYNQLSYQHLAYSYLYGRVPPNYLTAYSDSVTGLTYVPRPPTQATAPTQTTSSLPAAPQPTPRPYSSSSSQSASSMSPAVPTPIRPDGRDVAMGMLAGAGVAGMMWGNPYYWW